MHTYAAIHIHVVFATWNRHAFLHREIRPDLHAYLAGIARNLGIDDVYAGGIEDHVHLLGRFSPSQSTSDLVGQIKKSSGDWIRERIPHFRWQRGFGAFSVSPDRVRSVQRYVMRQEEHHRRRTFCEEIERLCADLGVSIADLEIM
jgi:REP element-mobilizing transposase RayT